MSIAEPLPTQAREIVNMIRSGRTEEAIEMLSKVYGVKRVIIYKKPEWIGTKGEYKEWANSISLSPIAFNDPLTVLHEFGHHLMVQKYPAMPDVEKIRGATKFAEKFLENPHSEPKFNTAETIFRLAATDPYARFCWGYLSERERAPVAEIHEASKTDWWPVKAGLDELERMGLVEVKDDVWSLADFGRKVRDVQRTMAGVKVV